MIYHIIVRVKMRLRINFHFLKNNIEQKKEEEKVIKKYTNTIKKIREIKNEIINY